MIHFCGDCFFKEFDKQAPLYDLKIVNLRSEMKKKTEDLGNNGNV